MSSSPALAQPRYSTHRNDCNHHCELFKLCRSISEGPIGNGLSLWRASSQTAFLVPRLVSHDDSNSTLYVQLMTFYSPPAPIFGRWRIWSRSSYLTLMLMRVDQSDRSGPLSLRCVSDLGKLSRHHLAGYSILPLLVVRRAELLGCSALSWSW